MTNSLDSKERITWDQYFGEIASVVSKRSTCERLKVGCLIVKNNKIVASGYNGSVSGDEHCEDVGCLMRDGSCIRTVHAELNAIINCVEEGVSLKDAVIYVTHYPCYTCAKHIIQAGIKKVKYLEEYRTSIDTIQLFARNNIEVSVVKFH